MVSYLWLSLIKNIKVNAWTETYGKIRSLAIIGNDLYIGNKNYN